MLHLRRVLTETPLARQHERVMQGRPRNRAAAIPWQGFDRRGWPDEALRLALDAQQKLALGEYLAVDLFACVASAMALVGAPIDLVAAAAAIPSDEIRHADIALRMAGLMAGEDVSASWFDVQKKLVTRPLRPPDDAGAARRLHGRGARHRRVPRVRAALGLRRASDRPDRQGRLRRHRARRDPPRALRLVLPRVASAAVDARGEAARGGPHGRPRRRDRAALLPRPRRPAHGAQGGARVLVACSTRRPSASSSGASWRTRSSPGSTPSASARATRGRCGGRESEGTPVAERRAEPAMRRAPSAGREPCACRTRRCGARSPRASATPCARMSGVCCAGRPRCAPGRARRPCRTRRAVRHDLHAGGAIKGTLLRRRRRTRPSSASRAPSRWPPPTRARFRGHPAGRPRRGGGAGRLPARRRGRRRRRAGEPARGRTPRRRARRRTGPSDPAASLRRARGTPRRGRLPAGAGGQGPGTSGAVGQPRRLPLPDRRDRRA